MTNLLYFIGGFIVAFGVIAVFNFAFQRFVLKKIYDDRDNFNKEALIHWKRLEDIWQNISEDINHWKRSL